VALLDTELPEALRFATEMACARDALRILSG
jgi:hypothetical protein